jgi:membrane associated rhomboid family serine protease
MNSASPVSTVILATFVAVSLYGLWRSPALIERHLLRPAQVFRGGQWHTLITSGFIHADLSHLLFNAFTFWAFAFGLERAIGSGRFLALYVVGLLVSSLGTWWRHQREPGYRSLGASGAILAVLFASILYFPGSSLFILPIPVPIPAPLFAVGYLAYSIWASRRAQGRVNHDAHLGGAIAGVLFVLATDPGTVARAFGKFLGQ